MQMIFEKGLLQRVPQRIAWEYGGLTNTAQW